MARRDCIIQGNGEDSPGVFHFHLDRDLVRYWMCFSLSCVGKSKDAAPEQRLMGVVRVDEMR